MWTIEMVNTKTTLHSRCVQLNFSSNWLRCRMKPFTLIRVVGWFLDICNYMVAECYLIIPVHIILSSLGSQFIFNCCYLEVDERNNSFLSKLWLIVYVFCISVEFKFVCRNKSNYPAQKALQLRLTLIFFSKSWWNSY